MPYHRTVTPYSMHGARSDLDTSWRRGARYPHRRHGGPSAQIIEAFRLAFVPGETVTHKQGAAVAPKTSVLEANKEAANTLRGFNGTHQGLHRPSARARAHTDARARHRHSRTHTCA